MKQGLLMLALVGVLSVGLTSCGVNRNDTAPNDGTAGSTAGSNGGMVNDTVTDDRVNEGAVEETVPHTGANANGNGAVGDINNDNVGNADAYTNDNANTKTKRTSNLYRSAYDYLNDGRYATDARGRISSQGGWLNVGPDLTQGARDLLRDAKDMAKDVGRGVGNAARDVGSAVRGTTNAAGNTVRSVMD